MDLEDLEVYNLSMELGDTVWFIVEKWGTFEKDTVGKQLVKAADSVAANISEGYGRFHYNESKHFLYYSRGSLHETKTWITKAKRRQLIADEIFVQLQKDIKTLTIKLNNYINSIGKTGSNKKTTTNISLDNA
jgi:four helix bundle protein